MKKQSFIIDYEVYPYQLLVAVGYTYIEFERLLKKRLPKDYHDEISGFSCKHMGETYMFGNGATVVHLNGNIRKEHLNGIIVHEAFHAVHYLMAEVGTPLSMDTSESYAYLIQYITNQITRRVK